MSLVHDDDAYGRLAALCSQHGWALELATLRKGMELVVRGPKNGRKGATLFIPGRENEAATHLLSRLKTAA